MRKNFVLDTNVLLHDPNAIYGFADNNVVIPIYCIEEIDQFKKDLSELGRNARQVSRILDHFRGQGHLVDGVQLPSGGLLRVLFTEKELPGHLLNTHSTDNKILAVALDLRDREDLPVVFVTMDSNLRIRADALDLPAVNYDRDRVDISELYSGQCELEASREQIDLLYQAGELEWDADPDLNFPNQYTLLRDRSDPGHTALARFGPEAKKLVKVPHFREGIWGIRPRNKEQTFALDLLINNRVKLVTLVGIAGTGKTLLAIAGGLHMTAEEGVFHKLLVSRPIFPLGKDIGYLPGDIEEKLNPWMQPVYDNVEFLMGLTRTDKRDGRSYQELIDMGLIEIEPLTYIRGRSIPGQYMIVDEAQNLTPHEVKTIITRAGDETKIILTGDPYQIDNPYVDSSSNGLTYVVNRFRGQAIAGHITLFKGERSELAELAANLL